MGPFENNISDQYLGMVYTCFYGQENIDHKKDQTQLNWAQDIPGNVSASWSHFGKEWNGDLLLCT